jgi:protein ImuB
LPAAAAHDPVPRSISDGPSPSPHEPALPMLWLCIHLPRLSLEALAPPADTAVGVFETQGSRRILIDASDTAHSRGVQTGMTVPAALGLLPDLRLLERNPVAEAQALQSVACWAYRYGAPVAWSAQHSSVFVEIRRSLKLFGGFKAFRIEAERDARSLDHAHAFGIAPTQAAASLLACTGAGFDRPIGRLGDLPMALRDRPLALLPFAPQVLDVLHGAGLRRIGQVLALPRDALSRRFGTAVSDQLDQLLGVRPEDWHAYEPPAQYRRRFELSGAVDSTEALRFPLRAMIGEFSLYLRARDVAVQSFRLLLIDGARQTLSLDIGLLAPTRDPLRLQLVLRERLDRVTLSEGVVELRLEADRFESAQIVQEDLFQSGASSEDAATLHERLRARLGSQSLHRLGVAADHRPEKAWTEAGQNATTLHPPRPLWMLPKPERITAPQRLGPAERIECGWWEGLPARRDYFVAEDESHRRVWVFRNADSDDWWLHGLWQ